MYGKGDGKKWRLWEYVGKVIFSHRLEQVKIVVVGEAASRESFYKVTFIGKIFLEGNFFDPMKFNENEDCLKRNWFYIWFYKLYQTTLYPRCKTSQPKKKLFLYLWLVAIFEVVTSVSLYIHRNRTMRFHPNNT